MHTCTTSALHYYYYYYYYLSIYISIVDIGSTAISLDSCISGTRYQSIAGRTYVVHTETNKITSK